MGAREEHLVTVGMAGDIVEGGSTGNVPSNGLSADRPGSSRLRAGLLFTAWELLVRTRAVAMRERRRRTYLPEDVWTRLTSRTF